MKKLPKIQFKKKIAIALSLTFVFSIVTIAFAQELQRTYTLINPSIEQNLKPGGYTEGTTRIINESNVPLNFNLDVRDYTVLDTQGIPQILPPNTLNNKYSAASWIGVSPSVFSLKPGQSQVVNYYIQVPFNARPGGHYAAIVYEPTNAGAQAATGGIVNTQIGSLFYITIAGPIKESASVTRFTANGFQEYGPVKILTQIKNFGDLHISPKGSIAVTGLFFNQRQDFPTRNIFPETARDFTSSFGNLLMLGRYRAQLTATYGQNNNLPLVATLYVWVFPWRLAIIIVLIIVAIWLGVTFYKKRKESEPKGSGEPKKETEKTEDKTKTSETA